MKALVSASNELPAKDQGLEALWDRFLVRLVVGGIAGTEKFNEMIAMPQALFDEKVEGSITDDEYKEWSKKIDQVVIPEYVFNVIQGIRKKIEKYNDDNKENIEKQIYVSDRRWRKIVRLMRTSAFLNDRTEIDLMDCFLIKHCIWNKEQQQNNADQFVKDAIEEYGYTGDFDFKGVREEIKEFQEEIKKETHFIKDKRKVVRVITHGDYYIIRGFEYRNTILISINDFKALEKKNSWVDLYCERDNSIVNYGSYDIRKGKYGMSLFITEKEYSLETKMQGDKRQITRKPHPGVEKDWNERQPNF
jgi:MoxR-like ATPase